MACDVTVPVRGTGREMGASLSNDRCVLMSVTDPKQTYFKRQALGLGKKRSEPRPLPAHEAIERAD